MYLKSHGSERLYSDDEILFPFIIFSLTYLKSYDERTFSWTITILDINVDVIKNIKNKL